MNRKFSKEEMIGLSAVAFKEGYEFAVLISTGYLEQNADTYQAKHKKALTEQVQAMVNALNNLGKAKLEEIITALVTERLEAIQKYEQEEKA